MAKFAKIEVLPDDDEHWEQARNGDIAARNYIVEYHMQFVYQIVHSLMRRLPHNVEKDDLVGYGSFGLIKAAETYDPSKSTFRTHAAFRINNAIYDGLRIEDWAPKSLRRNLKDIEQGRSQLFTALEREPSNDEIADYIGKDESWVARLRKIEDAAKPVTPPKDSHEHDGTIKHFFADKAAVNDTETTGEANHYQQKFIDWLVGLEDDLKVFWYCLYYLQYPPKKCREFLELSPREYSNLRKNLTLSFSQFMQNLRSNELDTTAGSTVE